eukprot:TRINITY_DN453_c0_g1_i5.p1 TRINITY_DN453_c0_g1~~TRINITY_DN453_c0_g1_i5.p1  ORF type:complete len:589 (+),score=82.99 TRINITY_DN453_c0_g1_i5:58-1824(+)
MISKALVILFSLLALSLAQVVPTTIAPVNPCGPNSWIADEFCDVCRCYSGYYGPVCENAISGCTYVPFENLNSRKEHTAYIDVPATRFGDGSITITVRSGSIQRTSTTGREDLIGVGDRILNQALELGLNSPIVIENPNAICRCFTQRTGGVSPTGFCQDIYVLSELWPTIRDACCTRTEDPYYVVFDCTLDVIHFDQVTFPPDWQNVTTRGRYSRFPLPLFIRFQKQINLTTDIWVFADIDIKAYIAYQEYIIATNRGHIEIDVSVLYPYILSLNSWNQTLSQFFDSTVTFNIRNDVNPVRGCSNNPYDICWQTIFIDVIPRNVCNLDNVFWFNFTVACRTARCPILTTSQATTSIVAQINTENFCPAVTFDFPLNGSLFTFVGGSNASLWVATDNFIVYTLINGGFTANARQFCLRADVTVDPRRIGQGDVGSVISGTYYRSLYFSYNGATVGIYDDSRPLSPAPPASIGLVIDTATQYNRFGLGPNTAVACFYLTRVSLDAPTVPGLLDPLGLDWHEFPQQVNIRATLAVYYDGVVKRDTSGSSIELNTQANVQADTVDEARDSSAYLIFINMFAVLGALITLAF